MLKKQPGVYAEGKCHHNKTLPTTVRNNQPPYPFRLQAEAPPQPRPLSWHQPAPAQISGNPQSLFVPQQGNQSSKQGARQSQARQILMNRHVGGGDAKPATKKFPEPREVNTCTQM